MNNVNYLDLVHRLDFVAKKHLPIPRQTANQLICDSLNKRRIDEESFRLTFMTHNFIWNKHLKEMIYLSGVYGCLQSYHSTRFRLGLTDFCGCDSCPIHGYLILSKIDGNFHVELSNSYPVLGNLVCWYKLTRSSCKRRKSVPYYLANESDEIDYSELTMKAQTQLFYNYQDSYIADDCLFTREGQFIISLKSDGVGNFISPMHRLFEGYEEMIWHTLDFVLDGKAAVGFRKGDLTVQQFNRFQHCYVRSCEIFGLRHRNLHKNMRFEPFFQNQCLPALNVNSRMLLPLDETVELSIPENVRRSECIIEQEIPSSNPIRIHGPIPINEIRKVPGYVDQFLTFEEWKEIILKNYKVNVNDTAFRMMYDHPDHMVWTSDYFKGMSDNTREMYAKKALELRNTTKKVYKEEAHTIVVESDYVHMGVLNCKMFKVPKNNNLSKEDIVNLYPKQVRKSFFDKKSKFKSELPAGKYKIKPLDLPLNNLDRADFKVIRKIPIYKEVASKIERKIAKYRNLAKKAAAEFHKKGLRRNPRIEIELEPAYHRILRRLRSEKTEMMSSYVHVSKVLKGKFDDRYMTDGFREFLIKHQSFLRHQKKLILSSDLSKNRLKELKAMGYIFTDQEKTQNTHLY